MFKLVTISPVCTLQSVSLEPNQVEAVSPYAKPVQLPPRAVPQSFMPKLKKKLDTMEQEVIIRPSSETLQTALSVI